jgi:hypothetical protein
MEPGVDAFDVSDVLADAGEDQVEPLGKWPCDRLARSMATDISVSELGVVKKSSSRS